MASSGTLTAGRSYITYQDGSQKSNFWWDFIWESTKIEPGKTRIDWTLKTRGRSSTPTQVKTILSITATYNSTNTNIYKTNNSDGYGETITYTGVTQASGQFVVNHSDSGEGQFKITFNFTKIYDVYSAYNGDLETIISLDPNSPKTTCTAPTSVTVTPAIQAPGEEIQINWSGAQPGNSDSIKNYWVGYRIGGSGEWTTEVALKSPHTIVLPEDATRGQIIEARVKTISSLENVQSKYTNSSNTSKVNIRPNKPTVTIKGPLELSTEQATTITVTAGSQDDDNQALKIKYKINDGSFKNYNGKITVTETGTYEFRTHDGLEYSLAVIKTFTKKVDPPIVKSVQITGDVLDSVNNDNKNCKYIISPLITIATEKTHKDGQQYICRLLYQKVLKNGNTGDEGSVSLGTFNSPSIQIADIRQYFQPTSEFGYKYKIEAKGTNGTDITDYARSEFFMVTRIPGLKKLKNKITDSDNDKDSYFSPRICPVFERDDGYSSMNFTIKNGNNNEARWTKQQLALNGESSLYHTFNTEKLPEGKNYNFVAQLRHNDLIFEEINCGSKTKTFSPVLENIQINPSLFQPLAPEKTEITFRNFFGTQTLSNKNALYGVELNNKGEFLVTLNITHGKISCSIDKYCKAISDSVLSMTLSSADISELFGDTILNQNITANSTLSLKTKYSIEVISNSIPVEIEYVNNSTAPQFVEDNNIKFSLSYNNSPPSIWTEGCMLNITNIKIKSAYKPTKINIYAIKGIINETIDLADKISETNGTYSISKLSINTPSNNKNIASSSHTITLTVYNTTNQSVSMEFNANNKSLPSVKSLTKGTGEIISAIYNNNNKTLTIDFNVTNFGTIDSINNGNRYASFTARVYYYDENTKKYDKLLSGGYLQRNLIFQESDKDLSPVSFTLGANQINKFANGLLKIKIKCGTRVWPGKAPSEIKDGEETNCIKSVWWSPEFTVYDLVPTVSYRKNRLGINHNFSDDTTEGVLIVHAHGEYNKVLLVGESKVVTINLSDGSIDGAIIEGGSW